MTGHLKRKSWAGQSVKNQENTFEVVKSVDSPNLLNFDKVGIVRVTRGDSMRTEKN